MNWNHLSRAGMTPRDKVEIRMFHETDGCWWLFVDVTYEGESSATSRAFAAKHTLEESFAEVESELRSDVQKRLDQARLAHRDLEAALLPGEAKP